ncbi:MAG: hypothetical protein ACRD93_03840 [Nitrososphaeraceae archaeon]
MGEYEEKIYDFIRKNPDCNQSAIRYSGICSEMWAIEKLKGLVKKGYVEDRRIGKAFHKYRVSDRKQYGLITKELDTIETEIMSMEKPLLKIAELQDSRDPAVPSLVQDFVIPYHQSTFARLFRLLKHSDIGIGKEDSLRLHTRIISLIAKVTREPFYDQNYKEILTGNKNLLNILMRDLFKRGTVRTGLSIDSLRSVVKNIERFEGRF